MPQGAVQMTKRTRVFLLVSAAVLAAVLATGLAARGGGALGASAPDELTYVPGAAGMVAYADVRQVMNSPFHDRFRQFQNANPSADGIETRTGIKFDRDVDSVLVASMDAPQPASPSSSALLIARGRFDSTRIEALMREQGGQVEQYRGKRIVSLKDDVAVPTLAFAEPGLLLFGASDNVRSALDAKAGAAQSIRGNTDFMALVGEVDEGTAWTVAKFDALLSQRGPLPDAVIGQLPPINWLAASGRIDAGLHGLVRAEARDEQSAQNLRDVVQGFLSLARLQRSRDPAYRQVLDSVTLNTKGSSVSLSFDVSPAVLDSLGAQAGGLRAR
jgi:hypothetical protein